MVVHFVKDEKVTEQIIQNFGRNKLENHFLVFVEQQSTEYRFIKTREKNITPFSLRDGDINTLISELKGNVIFCHAFHLDFAEAINELYCNIVIAWYPWGFDIYGLPKIKPSTYAPLTNRYLLKRSPTALLGRKVLQIDTLRKTLFRLFKIPDRYSVIQKALYKVTYVVTYIPNDYDILVKYYKYNFSLLNAPFSTIDQYLAGNKNERVNGDAKNILVGNSNTPENNHLDAISLLNSSGLTEDAKVYIPLSYGGNQHYRNNVLQFGGSQLGDQFFPLLDFMERSEYLNILRTCSVGVFYHFRQQAMGNIIAMLYMGARVYLSNKNPAFQFLKGEGIELFSLENIEEPINTKPLGLQKADYNRQILDSIFDQKEVLGKIDKVLIALTE